MANPAIKAFNQWLYREPESRRFKYYEGNLCKDRFIVFSFDDPIVNEPIDTLATEVWSTYLAGQTHLTQQKLGDGRYAYWATRTKEMR